MAYNANIPQPTDQLSQSQIDLLGNFQAIQTAFQTNHGAFNGANQGLHEFVQFTNRTGNTPVFAGASGLWSENFAFTGTKEIWSTRTGVLANMFPMTASILSTSPGALNNALGWTYLPSGIVMKWGVITVNGPTPVNLNAIGPVFGATFTAQATSQTAANVNVYIVSLLPATLTLDCTPANVPAYWFVVGRE